MLSCAVEVFVSDHVWDRPKLVVPPGGMQHFSMRFIHVIRGDASILNFGLATTQCIHVMSE